MFRVNASAKSLQPGFSIREAPNGRNLFDGSMLSLDGSFRLEVGDDIDLTEDGTFIFGGTIDQPAEAGFGGVSATDAITLRVSAVDYNEIADRRQVVLDIAAGSLEAALIALEPYYDDYGVTLDAAQATGPTLPALSFDGERLRDVLDQLSALTDYAWTWNISYEKVLGMYEIAATPAPFDVEDVDVADYVDGDITVEQPTASNYANYVTVLAGEGTRNIYFERHDGDGVTRSFVLDVTAIALIGALRIDGGAGGFLVGVYGVDTMEWTFDAATNAIIQDPGYPVIAVGHYIEMSYTGQFPLSVFADGGAAAADRRDKTYAEPTVFIRLVAQGLADAYLARDMRQPRTVRYGTFETGIHPGQTQLFDITKRNLSGQFVITDVQIQNTAGIRVRRNVTAVEGEILPASIGETVMAWGGSSTGASSGGVVTVVSSGGVGGSGTAGKIAKWATGAILTDSVLSESGTVMTIAGSLVVPTISGATSATGAWTFTSAPFISTTEPALYLNETDQGADLKAIRFDLQGGVLQVQTLTDAFAVLATILTLSRAGALAVSSGITAGSGAVGIIDSTGKIPAISSTYFASLSGVNLTGVDLLGAVNTHTAAGVHTWSGASATTNRLFVENTTSGPTAAASMRATAGTTGAFLIAYSQGWTTAGSAVQAAGEVIATGAGGVSITASHASGDVRVYSRNTLAATFGASQLLTLTGALAVTGTGTFTTHVLPATNYVSNLGATATKFLQAHIAELVVETLVAQNTTATIGGRVIVAPTNILTADLAPAGTLITVKYNNFTNGDRIRLEAEGKLEWMAVASVAGGSAGAYTYTVTRNLDGSGADQWYAGDAAVDTVNGFIDIYSTAGVLSGTGPTIVGNVRTGTTYSDIAARWAIGNLDGLYGVSGSLYGVAMGDAAAANLVIDATNGIRFRVGTTNYAVLASTTFTFGAAAGNRVAWDGTNLTVVSANLTIGSAGITLAPASGSSYSGQSSYRFTRPTVNGFGDTGDVYAIWSADGTADQYLTLENTVVGDATEYGNAYVFLTAKGWDRIGLGNFGTADITLESTQTHPGRVTVTASDTIRLQHIVTTSHTLRTGTGSDSTTYTQSNANLMAGNNGEAVGVAGSTSLANINFYLQGTAQRKATIQAVGGVGASSNGGRLLFFTKDDAASGTDVVQAGYVDFSTGGAGGGLVWGAPTGGSKGAGTINAVAVYDDNVLLTDWLFDLHYDGRTSIEHAGRLFSIAEVAAIAQAERRLPWMPSAENFETRRSLGSIVTSLWQGAEQMMIYEIDHEARITAMESEVATLRSEVARLRA